MWKNSFNFPYPEWYAVLQVILWKSFKRFAEWANLKSKILRIYLLISQNMPQTLPLKNQTVFVAIALIYTMHFINQLV